MGYIWSPDDIGIIKPPLKYPKKAFETHDEADEWCAEWDMACTRLRNCEYNLSTIPLTCIDPAPVSKHKSPGNIRKRKDCVITDGSMH